MTSKHSWKYCNSEGYETAVRSVVLEQNFKTLVRTLDYFCDLLRCNLKTYMKFESKSELKFDYKFSLQIDLECKLIRSDEKISKKVRLSCWQARLFSGINHSIETDLRNSFARSPVSVLLPGSWQYGVIVINRIWDTITYRFSTEKQSQFEFVSKLKIGLGLQSNLI